MDIGLIGRVLQNLIDNAIKFTPEGGEIRITAHQDEKQGLYRVCVIDNGPGIPSDVQTRLFQKFASGSEPGHGTGLGLAYCRLAVEAHGGHIFAASGPVGASADHQKRRGWRSFPVSKAAAPPAR